VDEAPRAAVDEGQRSRDQRVIRCAEPDLLGECEAKHHPRLAVVGQAVSHRAIDQGVEVGHPAQRLAGNRDRQPMVAWREAADRRAGGVERLPAPQDRIKHLQRRTARAEALSAWHDRSERSS